MAEKLKISSLTVQRSMKIKILEKIVEKFARNATKHAACIHTFIVEFPMSTSYIWL